MPGEERRWELSWSTICIREDRRPRAWKAAWEKTRHKIGCRGAGLWACEKLKPSRRGKLGLESVTWVFSS